MARTVSRLTALKVDRLKTPGVYGDGGGLWLQVKGDEAKSWTFRYSLHGRTREMGLGSLNTISLAAARDLAAECRKQRQAGVDPIDARKAERDKATLDAAKALTFRDCVKAYIAAHEAAWRNEKHVSQWRNTLETYAGPVIGGLPVQAIDTGLVMKVIEPLWPTKPETAGRLRGRIEAVLDWAAARKHRAGENPARWRGHLDKLLPARSKVRQVKHHAALPFADLPSFMAELREQPGQAARALEFLILTAARTGEVIAAAPSEIDAKAKVWTVPAERMKAGKEHRVPLSDRALAVIGSLDIQDGAAFVFPGPRRGKHMSNMAMAKLLERMKRDKITVHGFRSTFRDWAAERTSHPQHVVEMALAHAIGDKVEAAYRRGDLFEKRRKLMTDWARFCASTPAQAGGKVVEMSRRA